MPARPTRRHWLLGIVGGLTALFRPRRAAAAPAPLPTALASPAWHLPSCSVSPRIQTMTYSSYGDRVWYAQAGGDAPADAPDVPATPSAGEAAPSAGPAIPCTCGGRCPHCGR